ncbi:MAG: VOC family protein [Acidimicrobiia bacterium]|nr:VOC family protein [Acidimicrobiia bacterium]
MGSVRIGEINVMCRSIDSSLDFYRDALGLHEVGREGDAVRLSDGAAFVLLLPFAQDPAPDAPYESMVTISFDVLVDDVEATVRSLEAAGGLRAASLGEGEGWAVADPDGNVIEVLPHSDRSTS